MRDIKVERHDVQFKDIDCRNPPLILEAKDNDEDFNEMLDEILEEEHTKKAAQEEEDDDENSKKGSKKKGKKGKKKKQNKKVVNEEL